MQLPTLSVIIPCYNGRAFVGDAVRSVLDQADDRVECIVVDDGSTDGSAEAVRSAFGDRVRVVEQTNAGAAAARNRGFAEATGELVIWLDADDMLAPGTLAARRQAFLNDPELAMLVGQVKIINVDTGEEELSPRRCDADYLVRDLLARTNLPHSNILTIRREAVERIGLYDPALKIAEDYDFWIRAWAELKWKFVPAVFSIQRTGSFASLSRSRGKIYFYQQVGAALRKCRPYLRKSLGTDRPWRVGYSRYAADFAIIHLKRGEKSAAFRWALGAIMLTPTGVERRAYLYLLESALPDFLYQWSRSFLRRAGCVGRQSVRQ